MAYDIYPYTNLHNLNLDWILQEMKRVAAESASTAEAQKNLKEYVDTWLDQQDVPAEVARVIQDMADSGELVALLGGSIATQLTNRRGRRWIFIGDSYANRTDDWDDTLVDIWGLNRAELTAGDSYDDDTDCFTIRRGGFGFVGVTTTDPSIGGRWLDLCTEYWPADVENNTITDIVIVGGYNDRLSDVNSIKTAMAAFKTGFTDLFPNAHVWVAEVGMSANNRADRQRLRTVYTAYRSANDMDTWSYLAGCEGVLHRTGYLNTTDYHHPTPEGGRALGEAISALLQGVPMPAQEMTGTIASAAVIDGTISPDSIFWRSWYDPEEQTVSMLFDAGGSITLTNPVTFEAQDTRSIAALPDSYLFPTNAGQMPVVLAGCRGHDAGEAEHEATIPGRLFIDQEDGILKVQTFRLTPVGLTDVHVIYFPQIVKKSIFD